MLMHWNANAVEIQLPNQKLSTSYLIFHGRNVLLPVNYAITICGKKACGKEVYSKIKKKEKNINLCFTKNLKKLQKMSMGD